MIFCYIFLMIILNLSFFRNSHIHGSRDNKNIEVYHLIDNSLWGEVDGSAIQGVFPCNNNIRCEFISSDSIDNFEYNLRQKYINKTIINNKNNIFPTILSLYNIHTWGEISKWPHIPALCYIPSHLNMVESEESHSRFHKLFSSSFPYYDGFSTTNPTSSVPRSYISSFNTSSFLPLRPFHSLIKGAAFVASSCHRDKGIHTTKREEVVASIIKKNFRVDGLGKCLHTSNIPEGINLSTGNTALESLQLKQASLSRYMFYLAFENTNEPGYVTEKVFDAFIAGTVPIYLGSSEDCKKLIPHSKAAIFIQDFDNDVDRLVAYLEYLVKNESAYESHREWRKSFDINKLPSIVTASWPCRVCNWVEKNSYKISSKNKCNEANKIDFPRKRKRNNSYL